LKSVYNENLNISFTGTATLENTGIKFSGEVNIVIMNYNTSKSSIAHLTLNDSGS